MVCGVLRSMEYQLVGSVLSVEGDQPLGISGKNQRRPSMASEVEVGERVEEAVASGSVGMPTLTRRSMRGFVGEEVVEARVRESGPGAPIARS